MLPPKVLDKLRKRIDRLRKWRYRKVADVALDVAHTEEHLRRPPTHLGFQPAPVGSTWGEEWMTAWFRGTATVPESCAGQRVYYRHVSRSEKLLFVDGEPFSGMNPHHEEVLLLPEAKGGETLDLAVEAYTGHRISSFDPYDQVQFYHQVCGMDPGQTPPHTLDASALLVERAEALVLFYDADVLYRTALCFDENSLRRATILDQLNQAIDLIPQRWEAEEELASACTEARAAIAPLLACTNGSTMPHVGMVGYAHVDIAWLWPIRETIRKSARTFSNYLRLMEDYPELVFLQSQPVQLEMIAEHYPELLDPIKDAVKRGQWQPNGGMWIESGCNMPSGESLIRQFHEGRKSTMKHFDYYGDTLWLPDVFGYSGALPQILKICEIDNFVTSKINWNDTTLFPYDTFWWEGIDGSTVFSHFIPCRSEGYNSEVYPERIWESWNFVQHKEVQDSVLASVGYGDGGGGATREMCERARRMGDLEGCPRTSWVNLSEFLKRLREQPVERPRWVGELYLELHRGTYTSEGRIKRGNRRCEFTLREVELWSAMAMRHGLPYPHAALEDCWRRLLTNHCHDNIAGSCIKRTCEEIRADHQAILDEMTPLREQALARLAEALPGGGDGAYIVANPLSWDRTDLIILDGIAGSAMAGGKAAPVQLVEVDGERKLAALVDVESLAVTGIAVTDQAPVKTGSSFTHKKNELDTPHYRVVFDEAGAMTSLFDKAAGREVVQAGRKLNAFYGAEDFPIYWDAFDIDRFYRDVIQPEDRLESREVVADGPLFITFRSVYSVGRRSKLTQDLTFYAHSRRIDFHTWVDWHERNYLLKTGFAIDVRSNTWRNEIQYGHLERNRHTNTDHDRAQFEICAHKWVDVSEKEYGVALLNDCKYGHDSLDEMISLTLLSSAGGANEEADLGEHEFTYALLPHAGGFDVAAVVREAYALNVPLTVQPMPKETPGDAANLGLCSVSNPNVIVEAVKRAEEDDATVVRAYEAGQSRAGTEIRFSGAVAKAVECNGLERGETPVQLDGSTIRCTLRPFEIKTFKVWFE